MARPPREWRGGPGRSGVKAVSDGEGVTTGAVLAFAGASFSPCFLPIMPERKPRTEVRLPAGELNQVSQCRAARPPQQLQNLAILVSGRDSGAEVTGSAFRLRALPFLAALGWLPFLPFLRWDGAAVLRRLLDRGLVLRLVLLGVSAHGSVLSVMRFMFIILLLAS